MLPRTVEERGDHGDDEVPLLPMSDCEEGARSARTYSYFSPKTSVVGVIGLLCIFTFLATTTLFGVLYYKLIMKPSRLPKWPPPSHSLLGEYSTAAVAADNELCSEIGRDILLQGGNAVDAAIATLFCIGVMDTQSAGLGGGHFMTIYNATTKKCHVVDAREAAPLAATENMFKDKWNESSIGWKAIAVPGELHGMWTEYKHFGGRIPWTNLVKPTIELMQEGYPTSHAMAAALKQKEPYILEEKTMSKHFVNPETGKIYKLGEQIKTRENFIETLKTIAKAKDPVQEFYQGKLAKNMVDEFKQYGGLLTLKDFNQYQAKIRSDEDVIYTHLANKLIMNIFELPRTEDEAIKLLQEKGLLPKRRLCKNDHEMGLSIGKEVK